MQQRAAAGGAMGAAAAMKEQQALREKLKAHSNTFFQLVPAQRDYTRNIHTPDRLAKAVDELMQLTQQNVAGLVVLAAHAQRARGARSASPRGGVARRSEAASGRGVRAGRGVPESDGAPREREREVHLLS